MAWWSLLIAAVINGAVWLAALRWPEAPAVRRLRVAVRRTGRTFPFAGAAAAARTRDGGRRGAGPLRWIGRRLVRALPARIVRDVRAGLLQAGLRWEPAPYLAVRLGLAAAAATAMPIAALLLPSRAGRAGIAAAVVIMVALPGWWIARRRAAWARAVRGAFPNAVDLIALGLEAGQGLDVVLRECAELDGGPLSRLFARYLEDRAWGQSREEALERIAEHAGVVEVTHALRAVADALRLGAPAVRMLREQAAFLRNLALRKSEEEAQQLPIKLLVPLVLLIFPTLFIVLLGPVALQVMRQGWFAR
ncbi:MAG: type II secretion system F family protein [Armatimonadetes bacterium]|nr:type II secretion system F family protein [Armatimonadota bacterium]